MLKLKKIAVTGQLASGKSTICTFFNPDNSFIISADKIVHDLLATNHEIQKKVIQLLGPSIMQKQVINRKIIADIVFDDFDKLHALEEIIHPVVRDAIKKLFEKNHKNYKFFIVDFPLLFTVGMQNWFNHIIAVFADEKIRADRFIARGFTKEQFSKRSLALTTHDQQLKFADYSIQNNGTLDQLETKTKNIINNLKEKK